MLDEYFEQIGYTDEEITLIKTSYPINTYKESTLLYNLKNLVNYFNRNTLTNKDIIYVTTTLPQVISKSIENIKIRVNELLSFNFNKIEAFSLIKNYPYILEMSNERIKNKYQLLKDFGYNEKEINELLLLKTELLNIEQTNIKKRFSYLKELGYKNKDIIEITLKEPSILDMHQTKITNRLELLKDLGFGKEEVLNITIYLPEIYTLEKEEMNKKLDSLHRYGYTKKNIVHIIRRIPCILKENYIEAIPSKLELLEKLGFERKQIVAITEQNPYILLNTNEILEENFHNIIKNDLYNKEGIEMILKTPLLLTYNKSNINEKMKFYKENHLEEKIKNNSTILLENLEYMKAKRNIITDELIDDLFLKDELFLKKYKTTREELLREMK